MDLVSFLELLHHPVFNYLQYAQTGRMVQSYQRCKYPSMSKEGDTITQCDIDIGEVANDDYGQVDTTIQGAELQ